jgi:periplasmic protein TonB
MIMLQQRYLSNGLASRFSGLVIVVSLHLGAVMALMIGLTPKQDVVKIEDIIVKTIEDPKVKTLPPLPPPIEYSPPKINPPSTPIINVAVEGPYSGITPSSVETNAPTIVPKAPPTPASSPKKGLSAPAYPIESKKLGEEGAVGLALYLNEDGKVKDARVDTSSGFARLDEAAVKHATRSWKFEPCTDDKKPVACWHKIKFRFQLKDA